MSLAISAVMTSRAWCCASSTKTGRSLATPTLLVISHGVLDLALVERSGQRESPGEAGVRGHHLVDERGELDRIGVVLKGRDRLRVVFRPIT